MRYPLTHRYSNNTYIYSYILIDFSPHMRLQQEKQSNQIGASQTGEAYHYVSFLPINGHLYEMDGLKPWPLDHGK